ncbi:MAG: sulfite exporter TauE/SafE family protein [Acidobacteria bacterium]|nr:sulfite exporter TauE/SafE family protein [Acidobacteriota bacterium]
MLIVGIAKGGLGGGIAIVGVPLMAMVVSPVQAAAILLPILMVMDVLAMRVYWRQWDVPNLRILLPAALAGTVVGFLTARVVSADGLRLLVAAVALAYAAQYFWRGLGAAPSGPPRRALGWFWGLLAGFTSFSIHAGGPPLHAFLLPQRMHRSIFQATGICFFFVVNWSKVLPYAWLGQWTADNLATSLLLLPLAPVGVALGRYLHVRVDDELFYRVVYAGLLVIGVKLLYDVSLAA